ncbi:MAG: aldo/keto reductase [Opitutaceae bacterium]
MQNQILRGTGTTVSRLSLGTMTFGSQVGEAESARIIQRSIERGIRMIDTADGYNAGRTEEIVGRALQGRRDQVVLASKVCSHFQGDTHRDGGLHRWHVIKGVEDSLRRLGTDCLDICYLHKPDRSTPIEETLAAMDHLVSQGKVLYVGMSNFASWKVAEAVWKSEVNRWARPVVLQLPYNLITRSIEEECVEFSEEFKLGLVVYNPLAGGLLTGKHAPDKPLESTRLASNRHYHDRFWHPVNLKAVERLKAIAEAAGISLVELSLRWLLSRPVVDSVIVGVSSEAQLEANLAAVDGDLDTKTLEACGSVWTDIRGPHFAYCR